MKKNIFILLCHSLLYPDVIEVQLLLAQSSFFINQLEKKVKRLENIPFSATNKLTRALADKIKVYEDSSKYEESSSDWNEPIRTIPVRSPADMALDSKRASEENERLQEQRSFAGKKLQSYVSGADYDAYVDYLEKYKEDFKTILYTPSLQKPMRDKKQGEINEITQKFSYVLLSDKTLKSDTLGTLLKRVNEVRAFFLLGKIKIQ